MIILFFIGIGMFICTRTMEYIPLYTVSKTIAHSLKPKNIIGTFLPSHNVLCLPLYRDNKEKAQVIALLDSKKEEQKFLEVPSFIKGIAKSSDIKSNNYIISNHGNPFLFLNDHQRQIPACNFYFSPESMAYDNDAKVLFLAKVNRDHCYCSSLIAHRFGGSTIENATIEQSTSLYEGLGLLDTIMLMQNNKLLGIHSYSVVIWDTLTAQQLCTIKPQEKSVCEKIAILSPYTFLIANRNFCESTRHIDVWDTREQKSVQQFDVQLDCLQILKPFTSEYTFLTAETDHLFEKPGVVQMWDMRIGKANRQFKGKIKDIALHDNHIIGITRKQISIWDTANSSENPQQIISCELKEKKVIGLSNQPTLVSTEKGVLALFRNSFMLLKKVK